MFTIVDVYLLGVTFEIHQQELFRRANTERLIKQAVQPEFVPADEPASRSNYKHYGKRLVQPFSRLMKQSS